MRPAYIAPLLFFLVVITLAHTAHADVSVIVSGNTTEVLVTYNINAENTPTGMNAPRLVESSGVAYSELGQVNLNGGTVTTFTGG